MCEKHAILPLNLVGRHVSGDWGDVGQDDAKMNENAIAHGARVFSSYRLSDTDRVWVITEADRSSTCLLTPDEY